MQLVYLSPVPWSTFAQRPHKFVEWFHRSSGGDVLWVDPYPTRFPLLSDFRRFGGIKEDRQQPAWLRVLRPTAFPIEPLPGSGIINGIIWQALLKGIDTFARERPTILAVGKPSVLALAVLRRLGQITSVYDAMDDFPSFYSGWSRRALCWRERKLVVRVTHLLASSTALKRRWSKVRSDVQLVHNGLDAGALPAYAVPPLGRERKVFGYVGTIGAWFDWAWVSALAECRPTDTVRLIGPVFSPSSFVLPENVEMLPACTHRYALRAMQDFDVGLIPFKNSELTASVDPIKYYEYRALGLPVISTNFGEMAFRAADQGTFLCTMEEEIYSSVERALQYRADEEAIRQFVTGNSWEARFAATGLF